MSATLRDVARAAGVHVGTASRALNPETVGMVNSVTAKRVRDAADRLGYVPNPIARSLKTNRTLTLGAVVPDITNPVFAPIIRGIEDVAAAAGYNVLIANTDDEPRREQEQVASLRARQVDGLILASARLDDPVVSALSAAEVPTVLVNRVEPEHPVSSVAGDDAGGIRQGFRHLYDLGHRRIAHIAGPSSTSTGVTRRRTFRLEIGEFGLNPAQCPVVEAEAYRVEAGSECTATLLDAHPGVTAVMAANDLLAIGCYEELAGRGLSCPADISVVGFNDMPFVDKVWPPLTTIHVRHYDAGAEAARLMIDRLRDPSLPCKSVLLPVSLVVRGSTAPPAA
ncbi:LacI family DNA-binding transcriptional regulator [Rhizohabitans arisaemae]|uniref:LacI family DNA-binding transcriptional regulator n=1 Tax=Rhizohabitans arisaemae TaxID=2720610 RepID=UPI0024B271AC|nr:LacI family DNA-binding transcriptional regulator [Rhizohabitans arisaemae]